MYSRVVEIGGVKDEGLYDTETFKANIDKNDVRVINEDIAQQMRDKIDEAKRRRLNWWCSSSYGREYACWRRELCSLRS